MEKKERMGKKGVASVDSTLVCDKCLVRAIV